jgi:hypothetical protein
MSHYLLLVIGDNPKNQLAPFQEEDGKNSKYVVFETQYKKEEFKKEAQNIMDKIKDRSELVEKYKSYFNKGNYTKMFYDWNGGFECEETGNWGHWVNPNAKWDWYELGGRWRGFFKLKKGSKGIIGKSGGLRNKQPKIGYVDQALKKDIDFKGMKKEAAKQALERYNKVEYLFGGSIPKLQFTWDYLINHEDFKNKDRYELLKIYNNQEGLLKFNKIKSENNFSQEDKSFLNFLDLDDYQCTKKQFIQHHENSVLSTFAVLKNGQWYEKGKIGWWGVAHNEKEQDQWNKEFDNLINDLEDNTLLSVYDCHV